MSVEVGIYVNLCIFTLPVSCIGRKRDCPAKPHLLCADRGPQQGQGQGQGQGPCSWGLIRGFHRGKVPGSRGGGGRHFSSWPCLVAQDTLLRLASLHTELVQLRKGLQLS